MKKVFFLSLIFLAQTTFASALSIRDVAGAWTLESFVELREDGSQISWCVGPTGMLIYTESGFMSVAINCDKSTPEGSPSTEAGHRQFYSGRFSIDNAQAAIVHHVTNSTMEKFMGKDLVRLATVEGDVLTLTAVIPARKTKNILRWVRSK